MHFTIYTRSILVVYITNNYCVSMLVKHIYGVPNTVRWKDSIRFFFFELMNLIHEMHCSL